MTHLKPWTPVSIRSLSAKFSTVQGLLLLTLVCAISLGYLAIGMASGVRLLAALALATCIAASVLVLAVQTRRLHRDAPSRTREATDRALRAESALRQLREALDELPCGLEIYDSDDRLLLFNKRLVELYPWIGFDKKAGNTFESILREALSQGRVSTAVGHEEDWLAQRLATRGTRDEPILQSLKSGHWINTYERRTLSNYVVGVRLEVTDLVQKTRELEASEARLQTIIGSAAAAIVSMDERGDVVQLNAATLQLFGYAESEVIGQPLSKLVPGFGAAAHGDGAGTERPIRPVRDVQASGLSKAGQPLHVQVSISEIDSAQDRQFVAIITDLTQRQQAEDARLSASRLEAENSRIQEASRLKSQFLANMSHEIRTPLNAIVGLNYLMRRDGIAPEQSARLDKIDSASKHLLSIINDILDLAKIEAGRVELESANFHLSAVLDSVHSIIAESARAKGLAVETDGDAVPLWLRGDPTRLRQALLNLAGNAVKFTDTGSIRLCAKLLEATGDELLVKFSVEDTGVGLAADQIPRLFEVFEQGDPSTTRNFGGTGLGLAITRHMAQLMGGECDVDSAPGVGSTFWFTARLRRGHGTLPTSQAANVATAEVQLRQHYGGASILLVEDNDVNREVALAMLHGVGLDVSVAVDGGQALEMAKAGFYDLVLMDMQMPVMGGVEATRAMRALPGWETRPILAVTANAFEEDRLACEAAGMNDFIVKPMEVDALYTSILKWLQPGAGRAVLSGLAAASDRTG
jgi:PAS domain S-box-containing protein